jgi:hypothetical protein
MDLLKKLNHKAQMDICILNAPTAFGGAMQEMTNEAQVSASLTAGTARFLLVFVDDRKALDTTVEEIRSHIDGTTVLWFAYPKKSSKRYRSDINRDEGWSILGRMGYEPVRQVSIDEDWSALRFKPVKEIKKLTRRKNMALSDEAIIRLENS